MESEFFKKLKSVRLSQTNMTVRKDLTTGSLFIPLNRVLLDLATIKFNKSSTVTNTSTDETFLNRPRLKLKRARDVRIRHQVDLMYMGRAVNYKKPMQLPIDNIIMCYGCVQSVFVVKSLKGQECGLG